MVIAVPCTAPYFMLVWVLFMDALPCNCSAITCHKRPALLADCLSGFGELPALLTSPQWLLHHTLRY